MWCFLHVHMKRTQLTWVWRPASAQHLHLSGNQILCFQPSPWPHVHEAVCELWHLNLQEAKQVVITPALINPYTDWNSAGGLSTSCSYRWCPCRCLPPRPRGPSASGWWGSPGCWCWTAAAPVWGCWCIQARQNVQCQSALAWTVFTHLPLRQQSYIARLRLT